MVDKAKIVSPSLVRPARLADLQPGELFLAIDGDEKFICGEFDGTRMIAMLTGANAFEAFEPREWRRPNGLAVRAVRCEVDISSAVLISNARAGSLVAGEHGTFLLTTSGGDGSYAITIDGGEIATLGDRPIAFSTWRVVCGPSERPVELFSQSTSDYRWENV